MQLNEMLLYRNKLFFNQDRDIRSDREMRDLKIRRMSEEDRSIEAKKEQARLSKHVVSR